GGRDDRDIRVAARTGRHRPDPRHRADRGRGDLGCPRHHPARALGGHSRPRRRPPARPARAPTPAFAATTRVGRPRPAGRWPMKLGEIAEPETSAGELNITPLIDIVFILLIFFVVTTTFVHDLGLTIDRPEASTGESQPLTLVRVAVSERGEITVDALPTSPWRVEAEVRDRLHDDPDAAVLVVADRGVHADTLVHVVDACRRGGAQRIALAVEAEPHGEP